MTDATRQIQLNGEPYNLEGSGPTTVRGLIDGLDLGARRVAVEVNGEVVPGAAHEAHELAAGDTVEVVTFVGGG